MKIDPQYIEKQEELLQFDRFDHAAAIEIGMMIYSRAMRAKLPVAIEISKNYQQLFHISMPGTTRDNNNWIKRKTNTVYHFERSSLAIQYMVENKEMDFSVFALDQKEYAAAGGAFPVRVKGSGVVGVIAVSGLASEEDHMLVVETIVEYLNN